MRADLDTASLGRAITSLTLPGLFIGRARRGGPEAARTLRRGDDRAAPATASARRRAAPAELRRLVRSGPMSIPPPSPGSAALVTGASAGIGE